MPTFKILLATDSDDSTDVEGIVSGLNSAINDHGLLGGNFMVEKATDDENSFWNEWEAKSRG